MLCCCCIIWDAVLKQDTSMCISAGLCGIIFQSLSISCFIAYDFVFVDVDFYVTFMQWFVLRKCFFCFYVTVGLNFMLLLFLFSILLYCLLYVAKQGPARCLRSPVDDEQIIGRVEVQSECSQNHVTRRQMPVTCDTGDDIQTW